jgi:hypothetical protein
VLSSGAPTSAPFSESLSHLPPRAEATAKSDVTLAQVNGTAPF